MKLYNAILMDRFSEHSELRKNGLSRLTTQRDKYQRMIITAEDKLLNDEIAAATFNKIEKRYSDLITEVNSHMQHIVELNIMDHLI